MLTGDASPSGRVVVVDELGFHQATSVAELLADRGAQVEILSPGMVVGQDLGVTLDLEHWWLRATAKGIVQTVDSVVVGMEDGGELRWVGQVGSGIDAALRARLNGLLRARLRPEPLVPCGVEGLWVEPGLYCTVSYAERTPAGNLRAPVFTELIEEAD